MAIYAINPKEIKNALRNVESKIIVQGVLAKGLRPLAVRDRRTDDALQAAGTFAFASGFVIGTVLMLGVPAMFAISRDYWVKLNGKEEVVLERKKSVSR